MGKDKFSVKGGLRDTANTVKIFKERKSFLASADNRFPPDTNALKVNMTAAALHPKIQRLIIREVEDHNGVAKSYYLESKDKPLAYFRAGQYLTFKINIGSAVVTRPYSIASAPSAALKNEYRITVKRIKGGFASDYILDNWKAGDEVTAYAPEGNFVYEPLRDADHIVAVAGGSGITPFLSLARAIDDGTEDCRLTLLYGCRNSEEILFKKELDEISARNDKLKVVYVLSASDEDGYEKGFIGAELIKKYAPDSLYSIFVCGPGAMYDHLAKEIQTLNIERKYVRFEISAGAKDPSLMPGFPADAKDKTFTITVLNRGVETKIQASSGETVLCALERAGIEVPARCRAGECGFCRSKATKGGVFIPESMDKRRIADARFGYIHPCCAYPVSDLTLKIN